MLSCFAIELLFDTAMFRNVSRVKYPGQQLDAIQEIALKITTLCAQGMPTVHFCTTRKYSVVDINSMQILRQEKLAKSLIFFTYLKLL